MIRFKVGIRPEIAIRRGSANFGETIVQLDDAFVEALSDAEREELIACVAKGSDTSLSSHGCSLPQPSIVDATPLGVRDYLRARIEARARDEALREANALAAQARERERQREELVSYLARPVEQWFRFQSFKESNIISFSDVPADLFAAHAAKVLEAVTFSREYAAKEAVALAAKAAALAQNKANIEAFVREHGTASDLKRFEAGLLPQKELLDMARDHVFEPLTGQARYARLIGSDIRHSADCGHDADGFQVIEATELTGKEFAYLDVFQTIVDTMPDASLEIREHQGECKNAGCPGPTIRRSVMVSVDWNGHTLTREYALTRLGEEIFT